MILYKVTPPKSKISLNNIQELFLIKTLTDVTVDKYWSSYDFKKVMYVKMENIMYKIFNKKHNKYLSYFKTPTIQGTYTLLLLESGSSLNQGYTWDKTPSKDQSFRTGCLPYWPWKWYS